MKQGINGGFFNRKTGTETGFDFVLSKVNVLSPLGMAEKKAAMPFFPGQETLLDEELDKVGAIKEFSLLEAEKTERLKEILHCLRDITGSIERAKKDTLSLVEFFELKSLLLNMEAMGKLLSENFQEAPFIPEEFKLIDTKELLDLLDPRGDRIKTFYIYEEYSEPLKDLRKRKKELDAQIKSLQESEENNPALEEERDEVNLKIEEEEFKVRKTLSQEIGAKSDILLENCRKIGRMDYVLAKAEFAGKYDCIRPNIIDEHRISITEGRHLQAEEILKAKGREYMPISIDLNTGVICITGANMGGKTISLKLAGLIPIMTQFGYFVPCKKADVGLSTYLHILIGDSQSVERGLSSFGSEMEELKDILEKAGSRSLILIDEIAAGTNPQEGQALTESIVDYLAKKPYITLLTTHYDMVTKDSNVSNIQVRGLAEADFGKLNRELSGAGRNERIEILGRYMDYTLRPVVQGEEVPRDAINIAKMLGLPDEIIQGAENR